MEKVACITRFACMASFICCCHAFKIKPCVAWQVKDGMDCVRIRGITALRVTRR